MSYLHVDLQLCIDAFERRMAYRFTAIEMPFLGGIRKEMGTLRVEVLSLIESYMIIISSIKPSAIQSSSLPRQTFWPFVKDNEMVPIIGTKRE